MIGKPVKSGARIKAERIVIENTICNEFLPIRAVKGINNRSVLERLLAEWGYVAKYDDRTGRMTGWQMVSKQPKKSETTQDNKISNEMIEQWLNEHPHRRNMPLQTWQNPINAKPR